MRVCCSALLRMQTLTGKDGKDGASKADQAKQLLAQYGSAYLITSISLAIVSFTACYFAVDSGGWGVVHGLLLCSRLAAGLVGLIAAHSANACCFKHLATGADTNRIQTGYKPIQPGYKPDTNRIQTAYKLDTNRTQTGYLPGTTRVRIGSITELVMKRV
eukprot:353578-Chlamydomonas_euryale.AAC.16